MNLRWLILRFHVIRQEHIPWYKNPKIHCAPLMVFENSHAFMADTGTSWKMLKVDAETPYEWTSSACTNQHYYISWYTTWPLGDGKQWEPFKFKDTFEPNRGKLKLHGRWRWDVSVSRVCRGIFELIRSCSHVHDELVSFLKASPTSFEHFNIDMTVTWLLLESIGIYFGMLDVLYINMFLFSV